MLAPRDFSRLAGVSCQFSTHLGSFLRLVRHVLSPPFTSLLTWVFFRMVFLFFSVPYQPWILHKVGQLCHVRSLPILHICQSSPVGNLSILGFTSCWSAMCFLYQPWILPEVCQPCPEAVPGQVDQYRLVVIPHRVEVPLLLVDTPVSSELPILPSPGPP